MARIIYTDELSPVLTGIHQDELLHIYNALDCMVTREILEKLLPSLDSPSRRATYDYSRAMQAPALDMMLRGVLVDPYERTSLLHQFILLERQLSEILDRYAEAVWDRPLNANSPAQLKSFFYDHMRLPPQHVIIKGERKVSTNREALEKLQNFFYAEPIVRVILAIRDVKKKQLVLKAGVDPDGRMRFSFNIVGTETLRWSSSTNVRGGGTNAQNIIPDIRRIFIADPGMKIGYSDLEQAESRVVAYESEDEALIAACESGDLHTFCAAIMWPEHVFGETLAERKARAELPYYRHFSYRDMSKRGGHACNYGAKAQTISKHLKIPVPVSEHFRQTYFEAFPGIPKYHLEVARDLFTHRKLSTCFGFERQFFGRPEDETTLREAIAFRPQSTVAQLLNRGLYRVWKAAPQLGVQLLLQIHDAIVYQFPVAREMEVVPAVEALLRETVRIRNRDMVIPVETKVGFMWWAPRKGQPKADGQLEVWKADGRTTAQRRPEFRSEASLLDFRLPGVYEAPEESGDLPQVGGY